MVRRRFRLSARVSSDKPSAIRPVLEEFVAGRGSVRSAREGFMVEAELSGESARDLNRMLLSQLRRAERRTRLRAEWTSNGVAERFFDYVSKGKRKSNSQDP